jgi:hypothetical protein
MFVQLQKEFLGRKPGERIDVSESDANALIAQQLATPVTDDLITPAVQRAMEQAFSGFQKDLDAVINAALKQFQGAQQKSRKNAVPAIFGDNGDGDPHGKTFGDWLVNVAVATTGKGDRAAAVKRLNKEKCPRPLFSSSIPRARYDRSPLPCHRSEAKPR